MRLVNDSLKYQCGGGGDEDDDKKEQVYYLLALIVISHVSPDVVHVIYLSYFSVPLIG